MGMGPGVDSQVKVKKKKKKKKKNSATSKNQSFSAPYPVGVGQRDCTRWRGAAPRFSGRAEPRRRAMHRAGARAATTVVWFRRDLRLEDNPALTAAVRAGRVVAVFIWAPEEEGHYYPGRASRWWLSQSLRHLDCSLKSLGTSLVTKRSADSASCLADVVRSTGASQVFFNHLYDPLSLVRDHRLKEHLTSQGITVRSFNADLLYEPWEVNDDEGRPFTTFASFWNKCMSMPFDPAAPMLPPKRIIPGDTSRCASDNLIFEDESEKGSNALLARAWTPGWRNADKALAAFISGPLIDYSVNRKKADSTTTSLLSPHLHFGEISVRKVFHLVRMKQLVWANDGNLDGEESINLFLKSIGLREYSRYMSFNHPCSHERPLLAHLKFFPWVIDEGYFKAWRQGRTGYPLVDAGMRELWATGWLHDRIRVVVSSFFVKVLQLPWRWGMKYFWDTLMDADLESDALGWQYISGSLPDGRELDSIDNPQFEGYKFDPDGEYVRRWLPELARLPTDWIHHPWNAPESVLQAAGIELGSNYPLPIIEISAAKARIQQAIVQMWQLEAVSRAATENGTEEGLGDSSDVPPADFPPDLQMEVDREPTRVNANGGGGGDGGGGGGSTQRRLEDQMVPSISSIVRAGEDEGSVGLGTREEFLGFDQGRATRNGETTVDRRLRLFGQIGLEDEAESTSESSSSWTGRDGGVVPVWSQPAVSSSHSEHFIGQEGGSFIRRPPHQLMNWS
ncbi:cryptochrome 1 [Wolffia australiana]